MADTIRDRPALLALLADNQTGDISPQDMRDVVVSLFGVYGSIYVVDGATEQTGIGTTDVKVTGFANNGVAASGCTPDHTQDKITIDVSGDYLIIWQGSFSGSTNTEFTFTAYAGGVATPGRAVRKIGTGGDIGSMMFIAGASLNVGQDVEIFVKTDGPNHEMTAVHMALGIIKLG